MPANIESVRKLALGLPGVAEGICFGTPAFYVRRKLMLRLKEDGETLVVRCPRENREALIDADPDVFSVTEHYLNHPAILLSLGAVSQSLLSVMIEGAWRLQAPRALTSAFESDQADGKMKLEQKDAKDAKKTSGAHGRHRDDSLRT